MFSFDNLNNVNMESVQFTNLEASVFFNFNLVNSVKITQLSILNVKV